MFFSLSRLIAQLRGKQQPKPQTFDLQEHDIAALNSLIATDEWAVYLQLIDNVVAYRAEALLGTSDSQQLHYLRGEIAALRQMPLLVERIAKGQRDATSRQREPDKDANRAARRGAALYATPSWHA